MNDTLEAELKQYFNEHNQHKLAIKKNVENETEFLIKRIELIESDINSGKAKPYHNDLLIEMQNELKEKSEDLLKLTSKWEDFQVYEEYIASTKYDLQVFLGLLDQEVPNVQLLHTIASKYISKLIINRDTRRVYITLQLRNSEKLMYEKTIVTEWQ